MIKVVIRYKKRMVLINIDEQGMHYASHGQSWDHLGVLHVATLAKQEGFEVILWDELILGRANLSNLIQPGDIVGFSVVVTGITSAQVYAREAKKLGAAFVLCGNDQASFRAQQMLDNEAIDGVFMGDDLTPMRKVFKHILTTGQLPTVEVPGFAQRGQPMPTWERRADAEYFIIPDLSLYSNEYWEGVWRNHRELNGFEYKYPKALKNALILFAAGCSRGANTCAYCSIGDVWNIRKSDTEFIRQLIEAYKNFGINDFFSVTDSLYEMTGVLKQIIATGHTLPNLIMYARSQGIAQNPKNMELLKQIVEPGGVLKFNIGLDTGDDWVLKNGIEKGHGMDVQYQAVQHIKAAGVHLHCSFIFGSPGESHASCKHTFDFIHHLIKELGRQLIQVESDIWWLNFGAPCARVFHDYEYACTLAGKAGKSISQREWEYHFASRSHDLFVSWEISQKAWYRFFTNITIEEAMAYRDQVEQLMHEHGKLTGRAFFTSPAGQTKQFESEYNT